MNNDHNGTHTIQADRQEPQTLTTKSKAAQIDRWQMGLYLLGQMAAKGFCTNRSNLDDEEWSPRGCRVQTQSLNNKPLI
ncbi:hypothetical protein NPIL_262391 [Nephila pilipes]|uniref:Uncharacterized protein n=1 Tax=Nephila pilipes TaxID=299642 RepID=A0A8X6U713_NEPPI|nr:hypothetical protein NPIL_262391 [Nephila pilipes]